MNGITMWMEKYLVPVAAKIGSQKHLVALRDSFIGILPATLTGALAAVLRFTGEHQLHQVAVAQGAGVGLIGVDVHLQLVGSTHAAHHVFQQTGSLAGHPDGHDLSVVDAIGLRLLIREVEVAGGDDDALPDVQLALRADDLQSRRALDIGGHTDGAVLEAQLHRVGEGQLHLRIGTGGAEDTHLLDAPLRADEGELLPGGVVPAGRWA